MTFAHARNAVGCRVGFYLHGQLVKAGVITGIGFQSAFVRFDGQHFPKRVAPELLELETPTQTRRTG